MVRNRALGCLGDHVGTQAGPRLRKGSILTLPRPPQGTLLGAFSAPFPPWDARGTLKWRFLGGSVWRPFFIYFGSLLVAKAPKKGEHSVLFFKYFWCETRRHSTKKKAGIPSCFLYMFGNASRAQYRNAQGLIKRSKGIPKGSQKQCLLGAKFPSRCVKMDGPGFHDA